MADSRKSSTAKDSDQQGEAQYQEAIKLMRELGNQPMGLMSSWSYYDDPRRLVFVLSRYKFVAKMLEGTESVLEVGCGDAFGSRIVAQAVSRLMAVDFDPSFVESAKQIMSPRWPIEIRQQDVTQRAVEGSFNAVYALDVLEHIPAEREEAFLANMMAGLHENGTMIIGMPSIQSQAYGSSHSRAGHVNCKDQRQLKNLMQKYFHNVFMFSMNDEVVHTGFAGMAHYIIALSCGRKKSNS